jgi:two-component system, NarL family, response regulator NreC
MIGSPDGLTSSSIEDGGGMSVRVLLVDDHQLVREGLRALLEREQFQVVGEAGDGHDAIQRAQSLRPDVAVLDLSMPQLNGLDAAREITRVAPGIKVIALTVHTEDPYVISALRAGIKGYVLKSQATADLVQAIREVSRGMTYLSPGISRAVVEAYLAKTELPPDPLTGREREVLQLVAEGRTTKEIAQCLGISVKTADSHRTRIMRKLDIHATAGLVRHAIRLGLIQP